MIFSLEGNIGAGKSTFLNRIDEALTEAGIPHVCLQEPVSIWTRPIVDGKSLLELFYGDKQKYAFSFQFMVLQTRVQQMLECLKNNPGKVIVTERCHITDKMIFANTMYKSRFLRDDEMIVYNMWYDTCSQMFSDYLSGIIYLRSTPAVSCDRIISRNRKGEENISLDYLNNLHKIHDDWILSNDQNINVCTVDANLEEDKVDVEKVVEFIQAKYVQNISNISSPRI